MVIIEIGAGGQRTGRVAMIQNWPAFARRLGGKE
jgi:hypothetical protein